MAQVSCFMKEVESHISNVNAVNILKPSSIIYYRDYAELVATSSAEACYASGRSEGWRIFSKSGNLHNLVEIDLLMNVHIEEVDQGNAEWRELSLSLLGLEKMKEWHAKSAPNNCPQAIEGLRIWCQHRNSKSHNGRSEHCLTWPHLFPLRAFSWYLPAWAARTRASLFPLVVKPSGSQICKPMSWQSFTRRPIITARQSQR